MIRAVLLCLALTGCATRAPVTERVNVPVIVPCVREVPARPTFEFERLKVESSDGAKVLALARDLPRHLKYEGELVAVVDGCR